LKKKMFPSIKKTFTFKTFAMTDFYGGVMVGGDMYGGKGTTAGSLKSPWINYIRAERREERQTAVPRRQRLKLQQIAPMYRKVDKRGIPREPLYSERKLRPKREGPPSQNPWILFVKAARARGDKRPLRELSVLYRSQGAPLPKDEFDGERKYEGKYDRKPVRARPGMYKQRMDSPPEQMYGFTEKRSREPLDEEEVEQRLRNPQKRGVFAEFTPFRGSGRSRRYSPY
jgi:hypothetical protein